MSKPFKIRLEENDRPVATKTRTGSNLTTHDLLSRTADFPATRRATGAIQPSARASELMTTANFSQLPVAQADDTEVDAGVTPTEVDVTTLPARVSQTLAAAGSQMPEWHKVSNLPGNMNRAIRSLGKMLFGEFTRTPVNDVLMIGNLGGMGPNTSLEVNSVAGWLKKNATDLGVGDIDFENIMPGYVADINQYSTQDVRWMLVRDEFGSYIYAWPEQDSKMPATAEPSKQLTEASSILSSPKHPELKTNPGGVDVVRAAHKDFALSNKVELLDPKELTSVKSQRDSNDNPPIQAFKDRTSLSGDTKILFLTGNKGSATIRVQNNEYEVKLSQGDESQNFEVYQSLKEKFGEADVGDNGTLTYKLSRIDQVKPLLKHVVGPKYKMSLAFTAKPSGYIDRERFKEPKLGIWTQDIKNKRREAKLGYTQDPAKILKNKFNILFKKVILDAIAETKGIINIKIKSGAVESAKKLLTHLSALQDAYNELEYNLEQPYHHSTITVDYRIKKAAEYATWYYSAKDKQDLLHLPRGEFLDAVAKEKLTTEEFLKQALHDPTKLSLLIKFFKQSLF